MSSILPIPQHDQLPLYHVLLHWIAKWWEHRSCCKYSRYSWNAGLIYIVKNSCRFVWYNFRVCSPLFQAFPWGHMLQMFGHVFFCQTNRGGNFFLHEVLPRQNAWWLLNGTNPIIVAQILLEVKVFTEINVNEQTTKHSSEVSQISNNSKQ